MKTKQVLLMLLLSLALIGLGYLLHYLQYKSKDANYGVLEYKNGELEKAQGKLTTELAQVKHERDSLHERTEKDSRDTVKIYINHENEISHLRLLNADQQIDQLRRNLSAEGSH